MTVISRLRRKHMASQQPADASAGTRPSLSRLSSFSRSSRGSDKDGGVKKSKRSHTFPHGSLSSERPTFPSDQALDYFETGENSDADEEPELSRASIELDDLPIELIALIDSFVESLSAKVHPKPPNIQKLSQLFQDFYVLASSHINTHINALAIRHIHGVNPDLPQPPPQSTISSAASRLRSKASSLGSRDKPKTSLEQQMLTTEELVTRKKARKALESKRTLLEEAVERRLCEGIYDRIYRHRSTQDEAQDEKLRSKTAALALVGIGPSDLGVILGDDTQQDQSNEKETTSIKTSEIREQLEPARKDIIRMSESRYPLGKLNRLRAAHKSIVDTLAQFHPSASADEIMPMLIYTLITLPPENLDVISDLNFIQNFRWEIKLYGEAAYCLTNLEAAISFLETVDLATLRADEHPSGPAKGESRLATPNKEAPAPTFPQAAQALSASSQSTTATSTENATASKPDVPSSTLKPEPPSGNRRLSDLVNTPAQAINAASDAVLSTADQGLKTISNNLGESYSFLLGKLKERQESPKESLVVPKTLDDARKLMTTPPPEEDDNASEDVEQLKVLKREERALNPSLVTGRRDHSADSTRSGRSASSSKKVLFVDDQKDGATPAVAPAAAAALASQQSPAMLDQMRSLGNTFNPMARLSTLSIRGFGRSAPTPMPPTPLIPKDAKEVKETKEVKEIKEVKEVKEVKEAKEGKDLTDSAKLADGGDLATAFPDLAAALPPKETPKEMPKETKIKIARPIKRFIELENPGEIRLNEVLDLLKDYRRLAEALKKLDAFEET